MNKVLSVSSCDITMMKLYTVCDIIITGVRKSGLYNLADNVIAAQVALP
jgi:hypothetical protein